MAPRQRGRDAGVCKKKVTHVAESLRDSDAKRVQTPTGNRTSKESASRSDAATKKITGHWGEDAVGFKWTEADSVDDRLSQMDTGRFYSATIYSPQEATLKGIAVRIGNNSEAAVLFDTELLRVTCGWTGKFLEFNPARYGIIVPPKVGGEVEFHSPRQPGWAGKEGLGVGGQGSEKDPSFRDPRLKPFGPLPREWAKYRGLHLHGDRVVFEYSVGPDEVVVLESPWLETIDSASWITREVEVAPAKSELEMLVASAGTKIEVVGDEKFVSLSHGNGKTPITAKIAPRDEAVSFKLRFPVSVPESVNAEPQISRINTDLKSLSKPGPARWTAEITTRGVVLPDESGLVVDTLTLPFENPYRALMFVSGHDFGPFVVPPSGGKVNRSPSKPPSKGGTTNAAICTLHGDVWLVNGIDDKLDKLTWKRFATGLFQPLGLKIVNGVIHVVGRDQITRLHDLNGDGEADFYENFNNDAHVTTNGHEYVTCLETDKDGWFYFVKGNADGKTDHDGCLLRVSPDGRKLEVVGTGFRNANGIGIGQPAGEDREVVTVAPQEGEWTPGSGIFEVQPGGFHGYTPSAHRPEPSKNFTSPVCWIPRLQDNSCGGQVWLPPEHWGKNIPQSLHLSYGTSRMFLYLIERIGPEVIGVKRESSTGTPPSAFAAGNGVTQGGTVALPLKFESGVMRGRVNSHDGHLYVSGLRGWVSNAAKDGCFQRVRRVWTKSLHMPVSVEAWSNGVVIRFSELLRTDVAGDPDNYRVQRWNYRWSSAYGSPELRVSQPNQEGRDEVEIVSASPRRLLDRPGWSNSVFLELKDFRPVDQLSIEMFLVDPDGQPLDRRIDYTVHATRFQKKFGTPLEPKAHPGQVTEVGRANMIPGVRLAIRRADAAPADVAAWQSLRMAAWHFDPAEVRSLLGLKADENGAAELIADGAIEIPQRGKYQIAAEGAGECEVTIGERIVGNEVELARGWYRLRIVQRIAANELDKPISLRLLWGSKAFETEPVPPMSLLGERLPASSENLQRGRELFAQHLCARCHRVSDEVTAARTAMPELSAEGPSLVGVGSRLNGDWMFRWLLNPRAIRPSVRMPRLFADSDDGRQQASDVAAYLSSFIRRTGVRQPPDGRGGDSIQGLTHPGLPKDGARLFESLGCVGCHRLTPVDDDAAIAAAERMPLRHIGDKFLDSELHNFLLRPRQHFEWSRMPDFSLSRDEASSLSSWLTSEKNREAIAKRPDRPPGNIERGRVLFEKLGCRQCHRVTDDAPLPAAHLPSVFGKLFERGCLAAQDTSQQSTDARVVPDFGFDDSARAALQALLNRGDERQLANQSAVALSRRWVNELRCHSCHARDGKAALLPEILSEESDRGLVPENVPSLNWVGEKLHAPWLAAFLKGHAGDLPRPWLKLRMPSFSSTRSELLARGLAAEHGLSSESEPRDRPLPDGRGSEIGEALATRPGLLDCRQCHAIGELPPTGDKNTLLAPGINFALTRERVRFDFYRRFTLDPPRYDVTTRMPKLAVDGKTTKVGEVFDGDARQQFEAVWRFLQTVPSSTSDP